MKKILLVDDSPVIRKTLRKTLDGQNGWSVCGEAENGLEAIRQVQETNPDLIVLDLYMPVMSGLEASREIKRLMPNVSIVLFSQHDLVFLQQATHGLQIDAVVSKTEGAHRLIQSIERLLDPPSQASA